MVLAPPGQQPRAIRFNPARPLIEPNADDIVAAALDLGYLMPDDESVVASVSEVVRVDLPGDQWIDFKRLQGVGSLETDLFETEDGRRLGSEYNAALDGLLSYVLALHVAGVDVGIEPFPATLKDAIERITDDYT